MKKFKQLFRVEKPVIAMIHVPALPGTPKNKYHIKEILEIVRKEAEIYKRASVDSIMIENMHDLPYLTSGVGPEVTSHMTAVAMEVKKIAGEVPCGIQILAGANKEALAVALASGFQYIRGEGFVFAHVADEGIINSCAAELLRYRKNIGAEHIQIYTDIKKKHSSHSITSDVSIEETAHAAEFFLSDGLIVTGTATGVETDLSEIEKVKKSSKLPILVGSGVVHKNVEKYLEKADALIVGTYFKKESNWEDELDFDRIEKFMDKVKKLRK